MVPAPRGDDPRPQRRGARHQRRRPDHHGRPEDDRENAPRDRPHPAREARRPRSTTSTRSRSCARPTRGSSSWPRTCRPGRPRRPSRPSPRPATRASSPRPRACAPTRAARSRRTCWAYVDGNGKGVAGLEVQYDEALHRHGRCPAPTRSPRPASASRWPTPRSRRWCPGATSTTTIDRDLQWYSDQRLATSSLGRAPTTAWRSRWTSAPARSCRSRRRRRSTPTTRRHDRRPTPCTARSPTSSSPAGHEDDHDGGARRPGQDLGRHDDHCALGHGHRRFPIGDYSEHGVAEADAPPASSPSPRTSARSSRPSR